ncbi:hypothetical protein VR46_10875 [Streptomyces sp. NRRL S-444]|nr:hypothetical protein VR46_10875 [Streptomyces sp. NRRL S-444]
MPFIAHSGADPPATSPGSPSGPQFTAANSTRSSGARAPRYTTSVRPQPVIQGTRPRSRHPSATGSAVTGGRSCRKKAKPAVPRLAPEASAGAHCSRSAAASAPVAACSAFTRAKCWVCTNHVDGSVADSNSFTSRTT